MDFDHWIGWTGIVLAIVCAAVVVFDVLCMVLS
jgi:hypothetical protein